MTDDSRTSSIRPRVSGVFNDVSDAPKARSKQASPFSLRLTYAERTQLKAEAGAQPLGTYIRSRLLGDKAEKRRRLRPPGPDHQKLALVLAALGQSRLASNMNQIAKAANMGVLEVSAELTHDLEGACRAIADMREMVIAALGLKPESGE